MTTTNPPKATPIWPIVFGVIVSVLGLALFFLALLPRYESAEGRMLRYQGERAYLQGNDDQCIAELTQAILLLSNDIRSYNYRGLAYGRKNDNKHAVADFKQALQLDPRNEQIIFNLGFSYEELGDFKNALATYGDAIKYHPESSLAYNDYAWLLATCPKAEFRDGPKAVQYGTKACELSQWNNGASLDTLAAACAEVGDYANAVKWENQALNALDFSAADAVDAKTRLTLYQNHQPYHRDK